MPTPHPKRRPFSRSSLLRAAGVLLFVGVSPAPTLAADAPTPEELRQWREQARAFEHGEGVPRDPTQAVKLYCDGSRAGDAEAQYSLGWMYANGRGIARDDALAAFFFQLAAAQDHASAKKMLRFVGAATTTIPSCMRETPPPVDDTADLEFEFGNEKQKHLAELVRRLSPEYGVHPRLALAVARTESNFNPTAVSPKNAQGLMQLIPETAVRFNVRKPFDPEQNVRGGLSYLRWLLAYFKGDVELVAAAYNAGEGAVNRYRGVPPYAETRDYVKRIREAFRRDEHPFDPAVTEPSPDLAQIQKRRARLTS